VDAAGNLFIADYRENRVRKVAAATILEGNPVTYTFTIRNTSPASTDPVTISNVIDTVLGDLTAAAVAANGGNPIVLVPGKTFAFNQMSPALNAGAVTNAVFVHGHDDEGELATTCATATITVGNKAPAITVDTIGPGSIVHGQPATYKFTITNTSPASTDPVTVTSISDDLLGDLICVARIANGCKDIVLAPGESFTFSACSTTLDSVQVVNVVTVTAHDDENTIATASDTATVTVNFPPVAVDDRSLHNPIGLVTLVVALNDTDPNGDLLFGSVDLNPTTPGRQATLTTAGEGTWAADCSGNVTFTPEAAFSHDPTPVRYVVRDSTGLVSNEATITIDFIPVAANDFFKGNSAGTPLTIPVFDNDTMGDVVVPSTLQILGTANPGDPLVVCFQGTWSVNKMTGEITFTPESGFIGNPTPIQYTVEDNDGNKSGPVSVTIDYVRETGWRYKPVVKHTGHRPGDHRPLGAHRFGKADARFHTRGPFHLELN